MAVTRVSEALALVGRVGSSPTLRTNFKSHVLDSNVNYVLFAQPVHWLNAPLTPGR